MANLQTTSMSQSLWWQNRSMSMGKKMRSKEEQDIQFYRGSAVHEYVKKMHLSDVEKPSLVYLPSSLVLI